METRLMDMAAALIFQLVFHSILRCKRPFCHNSYKCTQSCRCINRLKFEYTIVSGIGLFAINCPYVCVCVHIMMKILLDVGGVWVAGADVHTDRQ